MFLPNSSSFVDYVGSSETLESDWAVVRFLVVSDCHHRALPSSTLA